MKEIKTLLNHLINYTENLYNIIKSTKLNMKVFVIFLLDMMTKTKTNLFYKHEYKNKISFF